MNRMNRTRKRIYGTMHLVLPAVLLSLFVVIIAIVHVPCMRLASHEALQLYQHYSMRNSAAADTQKIARLKTEIAQLDSALQHYERRSHGGEALVDKIYSYADSAGFATGKVEAGMPLQAANYRETAVTIEGTGSYRATGRFTELIENSGQATRIRQLVVKTGESDRAAAVLQVFYDIAIREEVASSYGGTNGAHKDHP